MTVCLFLIALEKAIFANKLHTVFFGPVDLKHSFLALYVLICVLLDLAVEENTLCALNSCVCVCVCVGVCRCVCVFI